MHQTRLPTGKHPVIDPHAVCTSTASGHRGIPRTRQHIRAPQPDESELTEPTAAVAHGLPHQALRRACQSIHARLGEKITLQDIADTACMSRFHFARLFRRSTGVSPMEYLLHTRLERAKMMLRQSASSICDIALAMGFADQSHFTRRFRKAVGMTPLQYARQHAKPGASAD